MNVESNEIAGEPTFGDWLSATDFRPRSFLQVNQRGDKLL